MVEAIAYRYRTGIPWRDLPREQCRPWQSVWKRHCRFAGDWTWDKVPNHIAVVKCRFASDLGGDIHEA
jgi:transposase